jgi:hypothetical protein
MGHFEERLNRVPAGYATFLREKKLALAKHQPYLVRCAREFLLFARDHGGYTFEQTPDPFSGQGWRTSGHEALATSARKMGQHGY